MNSHDDLLSRLAAAQETIMYQRHMMRRTDVAFWVLFCVSLVLALTVLLCFISHR